MKTNLDHLVIAAASLEQGLAYVKEVLGIDMPYGGEHLKMGTCNHLMQLGSQIFLEVIAIDPDMKPPEQPRWFGLDDPYIRNRIKEQPRLLTWVVNTDRIRSILSRAGLSFGRPVTLTRGSLTWQFGLPGDGRLLAGGMLPYVIEWETDVHPACNMTDLGCRLESLDLFHPYPDWLRGMLESIGAADLACIHPQPAGCVPYLSASIRTPDGVRILSGQDRKR